MADLYDRRSFGAISYFKVLQNMLTNQEAFDLVATKLLDQDGPSVQVDGVCRYRSDDGRRCAAGWLISDVYYHKTMEGVSLAADPRGIVIPYIQCDIDIAISLQFAHDNNSTSGYWERWIGCMKDVALEYGLNTDVFTAAGK